MIPLDKNIYEVVNLLVLLQRARKKDPAITTPEEEYLILVSKEHLAGANLSIPVFINTLKLLYDKGYLIPLSIYENKYHDGVRELVGDKYDHHIQTLANHGYQFIPENEVSHITDQIITKAPKAIQADLHSIADEKITYQDALDPIQKLLQNHTNDTVSIIVLLPYLDIENLLEKLNNNVSFDDIKDTSVWYDPIKYEFHLYDDVIPVSYQGKPNTQHHVLVLFNDSLEDGIIGFEDIHEYKPPALKRAMIRFIDKDERLKRIFTVHSTYVTINKQYLE
jgi:hypothetical protein